MSVKVKLYQNMTTEERRKAIAEIPADQRKQLLHRSEGMLRDIDAAFKAMKSARAIVDDLADITMSTTGYGAHTDRSIRRIWQELDDAFRLAGTAGRHTEDLVDALVEHEANDGEGGLSPRDPDPFRR